MAITKVSGHVIEPTTNITSHNINSSGIITATRFDGPLGVGLTDGNFSGIVTTGELKANGIGVTSLNVTGVSTFNDDVTFTGATSGRNVFFDKSENSLEFGDYTYAKFGLDEDLTIWSNNTASAINNKTGELRILSGTNVRILKRSDAGLGFAAQVANFNIDGACDFYHSGTKRIETTSTGAVVTGILTATTFVGNLTGNVTGTLQTAAQPNITSVGTLSSLDVTGNVSIGGVLTYEDVTNIDSIGIVTARAGVKIPDGQNLTLGSDGDIGMKHQSGHFEITNSTGNTYFNANGQLVLRNNQGGSVKELINGWVGVDLKYDNSTKLSTTSSGVTVTGDVTATGLIKTDTAGEGLHNTATNAYFFSHGSNETRLYHSANAQIKLSFRGSGDVLRGAVSADASGMHILTAGSSEQKGIRCITDGTTELYYSGNKKLETTNGGITVTGKIFADSLDMGDNERVLLGADDDLELYHHSNNSYIKNSTNALTIQSGAVYINDVANAKTSASFDTDGSVQINHNNALKLSTSTTGISVTGEVAATQDYPDIRPALDFNFAAVKKLDPRIVYFRTGPASYTDEFGKVVIVGESQPRFDHSFPEFWDEGTLGDSDSKGVSKGLLIEDTRTNIFKNNHNLKTVNDHASLSWTTNTTDTTAPDGTYTATKITGGASGSWSRFDNNNGLDVSTINFSDTFTYSVYMKTVGTSNVDVNIDYGDQGSKLFSVGQEWKRYAISSVHHNYGSTKFIDLDPRGDIYIWGLQVEKGTFPTSYIPTRGTTVTRGGDYVGIKDIGGPDHSDFWNTEEGTYLIDYEPLEIAVGDGVIIGSKRGNNGSGYPWPLYRHDTANTNNFKSYDLTNSIVSMSTTWAYRRETWALGFNGTNGSIVRNGTQLQTNNTNMRGLIDANELWLGSSGTGSLYSMHIRRFMYYPKRVSDSQLKTLTS